MTSPIVTRMIDHGATKFPVEIFKTMKEPKKKINHNKLSNDEIKIINNEITKINRLHAKLHFF